MKIRSLLMIACTCLVLFAAQTIALAQIDPLYQAANDYISLTRATAVADDGNGNAYMAGDFEDTLTLGSFVMVSTPFNVGSASHRTAGFIGKYNYNTDAWQWASMITLVPYNTGAAQQQSGQSVKDMVRDNAGNLYITGFYHGTIKFGSITLNSTKQGAYPTTDIYVAKINASGSFVWARNLGSKTGDDLVNAIALDNNNNVCVSGVYVIKKTGCNTSYAGTSYAIYVAKLNNAGAIQWEKQYSSGSGNCSFIGANDVATDASGNIYATGRYGGTVSFGNGPALSLTSAGLDDVFTLKLNSSGTSQWVKSGGSAGNDEGYSMHVESTGTVYVGGRFGGNSGGTITFNPLSLSSADGDTDGFMVRYSSAGLPVWLVNPGPAADFLPRRIISQNGQLMAADPVQGFTAIASNDGGILSTTPFLVNGTNLDPGITGTFITNDLESAGTGFVFCLNAVCGTITIDGVEFNSSCTNCAVECDGTGDMILARSGSGSPIVPPGMENFSGINDMPDAIEDLITVYPNPAADEVNMVFTAVSETTTLSLVNHLGQVVDSHVIEPGMTSARFSLEQSMHPTGVYFLCMRLGERIISKRFVIAR